MLFVLFVPRGTFVVFKGGWFFDVPRGTSKKLPAKQNQ
jgi:hypothetical protein